MTLFAGLLVVYLLPALILGAWQFIIREDKSFRAFLHAALVGLCWPLFLLMILMWR